MRRTNKVELDRCPKGYLAWTFVVVGMVFALAGYLVYANVKEAGVSAGTSPMSAEKPPRTDDNVILTEHINEELDYEKPVCKRLEESGKRYEQEGHDGEI